MSAELRALRSKDGRVSSVAFSDALVPISEVYDLLPEPQPCLLQTRASASEDETEPQFENANFLLYPNGSLIEKTAEFSVKSMVGPMVVMHAGVLVYDAVIHARVELEHGVTVDSQTELEEGVFIGHSTGLERRSTIGPRTQIGSASTVVSSRFGPNCNIGNGATIRSSEIAGSLTTGDDVQLFKANIFSGVKLGDNVEATHNLTAQDQVVIGRGSLIGANVRIATRAHVGEDCLLDDNITIDADATVQNGVIVGARSRIDTGAVLLEGSDVGERAYIGPYSEVYARVANDAYIAFKRAPIPVWPIPRRIFKDSLPTTD